MTRVREICVNKSLNRSGNDLNITEDRDVTGHNVIKGHGGEEWLILYALEPTLRENTALKQKLYCSYDEPTQSAMALFNTLTNSSATF